MSTEKGFTGSMAARPGRSSTAATASASPEKENPKNPVPYSAFNVAVNRPLRHEGGRGDAHKNKKMQRTMTITIMITHSQRNAAGK
jgi:hypothetical protein